MAEDPIGVRGGLNSYSFVAGNPTGLIDPLGLAVEDYLPDGAPIVTLGKAFGGIAAYVWGAITGDEALKSAASEGLGCSRADNVEVLGLMLGAGRGGKVVRGRYEFPDQTAGGTPYVGQSGNIPRRLIEHQQAGRLQPGTESSVSVPGNKTAREVAEHKRIQELTGGVPASKSDQVSNRVDPIGPNRRHLLD